MITNKNNAAVRFTNFRYLKLPHYMFMTYSVEGDEGRKELQECIGPDVSWYYVNEAKSLILDNGGHFGI